MITKVNMTLGNRKDFYSKYSMNKISDELADYIYNECNGENFRNHVVINIWTKLKLSDEEKSQMIDCIRRTFGLAVQDELYYYETRSNIKTILLIVGIVLVIIYYSQVASILREFILILGWIAIWESVYSILFDLPKDKMQIIRLKELAKARIYFVSDKESNS